MDIDGDQNQEFVDEDEIFGPSQPIAPLSPPLGPLDLNMAPLEEEEARRQGENKKDGDKEKKPRKPGVYLTVDRLGGPKGLRSLPKYFEGVKFRGKGREKEDLDKLLGKFEDWAQNLFPKLQFIDVVDRIEGFPPAKVRSQARSLNENTAEGEIADNENNERMNENNDNINDEDMKENNDGLDNTGINGELNNFNDEIVLDDELDDQNFDDIST